jgi:hypothetical protein
MKSFSRVAATGRSYIEPLDTYRLMLWERAAPATGAGMTIFLGH